MLKEIEILEIQQRLTSKTEITANILVFDLYFFAWSPSMKFYLTGSALAFLREGPWFDPKQHHIFSLVYIVNWIFGISAE